MFSFQNDRYPYDERIGPRSAIRPPSNATLAPKTHLFVFQPQQQDFLHQRQLRLFVPLLGFTDISRVESDLMSIFGAGERSLRNAVVESGAIARHGRRHSAVVVLVSASGSTATSSASQAPG